MTSPSDYHVYAQGVGGWLVRQGPDGPVLSRHLTRGQAVAHAQRLVRDHQGSTRLVVHGLDGMVLHETVYDGPMAAVG